jgi:hypothetical protein
MFGEKGNDGSMGMGVRLKGGSFPRFGESLGGFTQSFRRPAKNIRRVALFSGAAPPLILRTLESFCRASGSFNHAPAFSSHAAGSCLGVVPSSSHTLEPIYGMQTSASRALHCTSHTWQSASHTQSCSSHASEPASRMQTPASHTLEAASRTLESFDHANKSFTGAGKSFPDTNFGQIHPKRAIPPCS